jgi:hypothetical protein
MKEREGEKLRRERERKITIDWWVGLLIDDTRQKADNRGVGTEGPGLGRDWWRGGGVAGKFASGFKTDK